MKKTTFYINGMTCSACSAHVDKIVRAMSGVSKVVVQLLANTMVVDYDDTIVDAQHICQEVTKAGYSTSVKSKSNIGTSIDSHKDKIASDIKQMQVRLWVSFGLLIPLMYIAMGSMMNLPMPSILVGEKNAVIFAFTQFLLTLPVLIVNKKYFVQGFKNLFKLHPNMDSLIAVGSGASFVYGIIAIFIMSYAQNHNNLELVHNFMHDLYFETAVMILALVTLGKYFEVRSKGKTSEAIEKLVNLVPKTAIRLVNGLEEVVEVESIEVGDILLVKPGQAIPVDGIVIEGYTSVDESALTGESIPNAKSIDSLVMSASINGNGVIKIRATKVGEDSTIAQIISLVEDAANSKAPISKLADKISGIFVPIVMAISLISFIVWAVVGAEGISFALSMAIAVLVISCPCALGLATPVAIMVGTGAGAQSGILIKSGEILQLAHNINTVVLDKTGTITQGKPVVTDVIIAQGVSLNELLVVAMSIEQFSEHPLATAIINYTKEQGISSGQVIDFVNMPGKGVSAYIDNIQIFAGNKRLLEELNLNMTWIDDNSAKLAFEGKTPLFFATTDKVLGIIAVADIIKESSKEAIASLKAMNIKVIMLTGDNQMTAEAIARLIDIDEVIAEVLPQDKEAVIRAQQLNGKIVAMVGDGINDAPALARADVGIAIGAGMDIAIESADIVLMKNDLLDVANAIRLSKKVMNNIKGNLFWAFFYNIIGIPLAAGVLYPIWGLRLNPMIGAAAMSMSSVSVVLNALRLKLFKPLTHLNNNLLSDNSTIQQFNDTKHIDKVTISAETDSLLYIDSSNVEEQNNNKEVAIMNKKIVIDGMVCGHCSNRVNKVLNAIEGVSATVDLATKTANIKLTKELDNQFFIDLITNEGYTVISIN